MNRLYDSGWAGKNAETVGQAGGQADGSEGFRHSMGVKVCGTKVWIRKNMLKKLFLKLGALADPGAGVLVVRLGGGGSKALA